MANIIEVPAIQVDQWNREFFLTVLKARDLVGISYVAIRGQSDEEGAVQRIFNRERLASLRRYALHKGAYPSSIVLNWTAGTFPVFDEGVLSVPIESRSAQIIDGQHRVEGLRAAIEESSHIGDTEIPVSIYMNLDTKECADLFLSINTEQKPVPRSLVFDLYGIASEGFVDPAAVRARDIAMHLNDSEGSPYFKNIKLPNQPIRKGGVALSTAVAALKPLVESKGIFEQIDASELEVQKKIVENFFVVLREKYGDRWEDKSNAFMFAAGFTGGIDFLKLKLIPICNNMSPKDFSAGFISSLIDLPKEGLVRQDEIKGVGGKDAPKRVFDRLVDAFKPQQQISTSFKL